MGVKQSIVCEETVAWSYFFLTESFKKRWFLARRSVQVVGRLGTHSANTWCFFPHFMERDVVCEAACRDGL